MKFHFLWEQVTKKNIKLEYIGTKPLLRDFFEYLREKLGVKLSPNWIDLSSTTQQYDRGSMTDVPFCIDAKGGEKDE